MAFCSYKKRIPQKRTKLSGKKNLVRIQEEFKSTVINTFHVVNQIHVGY